jgi:DNA-directed RNA polymerase specialized sigma subunit
MNNQKDIKEIIKRIEILEKRDLAHTTQIKKLLDDNKSLRTKAITTNSYIDTIEDDFTEFKETNERLKSLLDNTNVCLKSDLNIFEFQLSNQDKFNFNMLNNINTLGDDLDNIKETIEVFTSTIDNKIKTSTKQISLTDKQRVLTNLYNKGLSNSQISKELNISQSAVSQCISAIKQKGFIFDKKDK